MRLVADSGVEERPRSALDLVVSIRGEPRLGGQHADDNQNPKCKRSRMHDVRLGQAAKPYAPRRATNALLSIVIASRPSWLTPQVVIETRPHSGRLVSRLAVMRLK